MAEGMRNGDRSNAVGNEPGYIIDGDPGRYGGGTYTAMANSRMDPTIQDYENVFGPAARDVKLDLQRNKRHARWHLPDALKGANPWLTDKIDGLITDTTSSPFTTKLLPYLYIENVDAKIKWNRWTFQEGLASRVPYESAARTLTQSKQSYSGYTVRQGLAITMEHNFMMSEKGRENFRHQLQQVVGSIQYTNDIDVHVALITAPSYAKERAERYFTSNKTDHQVIREYIDLFGFMQKNPNAMDIIIEEGKSVLRSWGAAEPDFMLTNSKLTFNMQMIPEKTSYLTQGPDGVKKLREGPNISTYRGLSIIYSRAFSMEDGAEPRDVMRRRVRVAEYYRIPWEQGIENKRFSFYDESKDAWVQFTWKQLYEMSRLPTDDINITTEAAAAAQTELVIVRPNIEHNMLGVIIGKGGMEDLGSTLWGQTELSVYDDSMHGIWGMSYKYSERAIVFNHKNMIRMWDVAYDSYNSGKDCTHLEWVFEHKRLDFETETYDLNKPYEGISMMVMNFAPPADGLQAPSQWPSPIVFHDDGAADNNNIAFMDGEHQSRIKRQPHRVFNSEFYRTRYADYRAIMPDFSHLHNPKAAGSASEENETSCNCMAFQGSMRIHAGEPGGVESVTEVTGSGHHGHDFVGVSTIRNGKGISMGSNNNAALTRIM